MIFPRSKEKSQLSHIFTLGPHKKKTSGTLSFPSLAKVFILPNVQGRVVKDTFLEHFQFEMTQLPFAQYTTFV